MDQANGYYCCEDGTGPYLYALFPLCLQCNEKPCGNCTWVYLPPDSETITFQRNLALVNGYRSSSQRTNVALFAPIGHVNAATRYASRSQSLLSPAIRSRQSETPMLAARTQSGVVYGPVNRNTPIVSCCACNGSSGVKYIHTHCSNCPHQYCSSCPVEWVKP